MATIGKVKSEHTLTGPKTSQPSTPVSTTPVNSRLPMSKFSTSPQTVFERKKVLSRTKLVIGDATSHLTRSSPSHPSSKVRDIIYHDASEKVNNCICDPVLLGDAASHPNCTFVNICNEHMQGAFRWSEYFWWLWILVGRIAQLLLASIFVFVAFKVALGGVYWLCGGMYKKGDENEMHVAEESMFHDEKEDEADQLDRTLMELNPSGFSLTETTHALSLLDILIMTLGSFLGWIGAVLLPNE